MNSVTNRTNVGIIGCGGQGAYHVEGYLGLPAKVRITAVSDVVEKRAKEKAKEWNVENWYTDYHELLKRDDIDVVDVIVPHNLHRDVTVDALESGKHVICEKPMAVNLEEADEMIREANKSGKKLMIAHNLRFVEQIQMTKNFVDAGDLGRIVLASSGSEEYLDLQGKDWRTSSKNGGGGAFTAGGIHIFDVFRWFFGDVDEVFGITEKLVHKNWDVEDNGAAFLRFKNGTVAKFMQTWTMKGGGKWEIKVCGERGSVVADFSYRHGNIRLYTENLDKRFRGWVTYPPGERYTDSFKKELEHFLDCVREDKTPLITGEEGRAALEILLAVYKSAETGKWIKL